MVDLVSIEFGFHIDEMLSDVGRGRFDWDVRLTARQTGPRSNVQTFIGPIGLYSTVSMELTILLICLKKSK